MLRQVEGEQKRKLKLQGRSTAWVRSEVEKWAQEPIDARETGA